MSQQLHHQLKTLKNTRANVQKQYNQITAQVDLKEDLELTLQTYDEAIAKLENEIASRKAAAEKERAEAKALAEKETREKELAGKEAADRKAAEEKLAAERKQQEQAHLEQAQRGANPAGFDAPGNTVQPGQPLNGNEGETLQGHRPADDGAA